MIDSSYIKRIAEGGVIVYLRKSRDLGDTEDALSNHRMILEDLCKRHNLSYVIKEEIGSSDTIEFRPVFKEIFEQDIPSGMFSAIVAMDWDRISRNLGDSDRIKYALVLNDVLFIDKTERVYDFTNETDDMVNDFQSVIAKAEYQKTRKRMKAGKLAGAMKGHWVNGKAPYGYEYSHKTKKLIPDTVGSPSPAEIVQSIYHDAFKGVSTSDVSYKLNRKGILSPKGSHWTSTTISRILHQEVYLGKTIYGKSSGSGHKNKKTTPLKFKDKSDWIIVNNAHPALIDEDVFNEVKSQLNRRKKVTATRKSKVSALSGLVRCGQCSSGLHVQRKDNNKNVIRSCWYKSPIGEKCINKGIAESKIIDEILKKVWEYRNEIAVALDKGQEGDSAKEAILKEITDLQKELKSIKGKQDKLDDFLEEGIYTKEKYLSRLDKLIAKEKDVESELSLLKHQLKKQDAVQDKDKIALLDIVLNNFDKIVSEEDKNKLFKAIISHVDLTRLSNKDEGNITVNFH